MNIDTLKAKGKACYTFRNREGQTVQLRGDLTIVDLVRMEYDDIRLAQPETPLEHHEWRCNEYKPYEPEKSASEAAERFLLAQTGCATWDEMAENLWRTSEVYEMLRKFIMANV